MKKSSAAGDSLLRTVLRMVCWIVLIISALLATYMAAALAGSLMPANMGWVEPGQGVRIFVYSNGVHTGIVVPTANKVKDWRSLVRPNDLSDPRYAGDHLLFGWGERNFYLQTPSWSDLDLSVAARALIYGRRTLLHVDHVHDPRPGPDMRPVTISEAQYALLVRRIDAYFALDPYGAPRPIKGYGPSDVLDRKSVASGKSLSVRVDIGGVRTLKKKKNHK